jgi:hypothetical protein
LPKENLGVLCLPLLVAIALPGCAMPTYVVREPTYIAGDTELAPIHARAQPTRPIPPKPPAPPSTQLSQADKETLFEAFLAWRQRSQRTALNE